MHDIINHTLFTIGGDTPVLLIDLVTSVFGLACVVLAGRNSKYNFWIGYVYTALLFLMFWNKHLYASLILQPISLGINILGHYRWTHPKKDEVSSRDHKSLKVSMLTWPQRAVAVISVFVLAVLWGKLLSLVRDCTDTGGPVPVRHEEMGLLDSLASGECHTAVAAYFRRPCVHADSLRPLSDKRSGVSGELVPTVLEESVIHL